MTQTPIKKKYLSSTKNEMVSAPASSNTLMSEEIILNENLSNMNPQKNLPKPLKIAPQLPMMVKKESFYILSMPYSL